MADNHNLIDCLSPPPLGMRQHQSAFTAAATENNSGCGEIVEVQGGHIVRSIGKKDRHSKVCTAKGPRDRRVRLSAPTAIQFYDVQDRLGFDRPSKAVDWLIKKAKSAIDDLAELPPWNPVDTLRQHKAAANARQRKTKTLISPPPPQHEELNLPFSVGTRGGFVSAGEETEHCHIGEETEHHQIGEEDNESSFLPASMDSDSIADTIKSFFPVASTQQPPSQTNTQSQDLRLSLQSFQNGPPFTNQTESVLFSGQNNTPLVFDSSATNWEQTHPSPEFGKIQRLVTWNNTGAADSTGGGFVFASSSPSSFQPVYSQSQLFSQRGPLQSINTPLFRAWCDPHHPHSHHHQSITSNDLHNPHHHHHPYHVHPSIHHSAIPGIAGFRIPARFHGELEDHGGNNNKPSSDSRH